jgi:NhaP-type Na+/H+ or K+/H+ antiporter
MTWDQIEATTPHLTYLIGSAFLILYALFSSFIKNRLHLSEPPLAMLLGIIFGPMGAGALDPRSESDTITQEMARV